MFLALIRRHKCTSRCRRLENDAGLGAGRSSAKPRLKIGEEDRHLFAALGPEDRQILALRDEERSMGSLVAVAGGRHAWWTSAVETGALRAGVPRTERMAVPEAGCSVAQHGS